MRYCSYACFGLVLVFLASLLLGVVMSGWSIVTIIGHLVAIAVFLTAGLGLRQHSQRIQALENAVNRGEADS